MPSGCPSFPLPARSSRRFFAPPDESQFTGQPVVFAFSATLLQGTYMTTARHREYGKFQELQQPIAVLGGSIYLYEEP